MTPAAKVTAPSRIRAYFAALDYLQIAVMLLLLGVGLLFVYSTGHQIGGSQQNFFFHRQLWWIACGVVCYIGATLIDCRSIAFRAGVVLAYGAIILALLLVLVVGVKVYGATRWLEIGGLRLQPSEFVKPILSLVLALLFSLPGFAVNRVGGIGISFLLILLPFGLIAAEPDFGSAAVLLPIYAVVVFSAGLSWKKLLWAGIFLSVLSGVVIANEAWEYKPLLRPYQKERIMVFLDPDRDRSKSGYNVHQSKLAVGSGGMRGKGVGEGTQNSLGFLPRTVSNNDFIFSVIAEECGFIGVTGLLALYTLLLYSILRGAWSAADDFGRLFALGTAAMFFTHIFVNIGMCIGLVPVTGLSLPLVSYGGSFILAGMSSLGLLQSIRRQSRQLQNF